MYLNLNSHCSGRTDLSLYAVASNASLDQEARQGKYRAAKNLDALQLGTTLGMPKPCDFDYHRKSASILHLQLSGTDVSNDANDPTMA
jgi:hypothetical protein